MKKPSPLILSILGLAVIIAASAVVYKIYFEGKAVKEALTQPAPPALRPLPQLPKTLEPAKTARTGAETKRPDLSAAGALQKTPERIVSLVPYEYNPKGRRDPFKPLIVKAEPEKKRGGVVSLQNYGVNEFRLTAVLWNKSGFYALVSAEGKNFVLKEGTAIGLHGGKVDKIMKDSVIIKEFLKDYRGNVKPNYTVLKLRREE